MRKFYAVNKEVPVYVLQHFVVCHDAYFLDQFTRDYCKYVGGEIRLLATEALTLTTDYDDCYVPENPKLR